MGSDKDESTPLLSFYDTVMGRAEAIESDTCIKFCCGRKLVPGEKMEWTSGQRHTYFDTGMCNRCQDTFYEVNPDDLVGDFTDDESEQDLIDDYQPGIESGLRYWSRCFVVLLELAAVFVVIELVLGQGLHVAEQWRAILFLVVSTILGYRAMKRGIL